MMMGERALDVHTYDGKLDEDSCTMVRNATAESHPSFEATTEEIRARFANETPFMEKGLEAFATLPPADAVNRVDCRDCVRVAWAIVRDNDFGRPLFYEALDDMVRTRGCCPQGRSSRMIQLIAAFADASITE